MNYSGFCPEHGEYAMPGDPAYAEVVAAALADGRAPFENEVLGPDECPACDRQAAAAEYHAERERLGAAH
jgi:hypothetical protein